MKVVSFSSLPSRVLSPITPSPLSCMRSVVVTLSPADFFSSGLIWMSALVPSPVKPPMNVAFRASRSSFFDQSFWAEGSLTPYSVRAMA